MEHVAVARLLPQCRHVRSVACPSQVFPSPMTFGRTRPAPLYWGTSAAKRFEPSVTGDAACEGPATSAMAIQAVRVTLATALDEMGIMMPFGQRASTSGAAIEILPGPRRLQTS